MAFEKITHIIRSCFLSQITPVPCQRMLSIGIKENGRILLHFIFPSIPGLSGKESSTEIFFQNYFLVSVFEHPYYMLRQLYSFNTHVSCRVNIFIQSLQVFIESYSPESVKLCWSKYFFKNKAIVQCQ